MSEKIGALIRLLIAAVLLALLALMLDINSLINTIAGMDVRYFLCAPALMPVMVIINCYRWRLLANRIVKVDFMDSIKSFLAGNALGILTPARAGELTRAAYLPVENKGRFVGLVVLSG